MSNPWFRLYSEFSHDSKVQMMPEAMQRRYVMIMCLRCSNNLVTLHETEIAFHLRITELELAETKALFISKGFIDDKWSLLNWDKRQFVSDNSAERVKRHRAKRAEQGLPQQNAILKDEYCDRNGLVTLLKRKANVVDTEQIQRTDTEQKIKPKSATAIAFDGTTWINTECYFELWAKAYPAIDLKTELAKAAAWLIANPKNRKSNYARFLTSWFVRAQDRAPTKNNSPNLATNAKTANRAQYAAEAAQANERLNNGYSEIDITAQSTRIA